VLGSRSPRSKTVFTAPAITEYHCCSSSVSGHHRGTSADCAAPRRLASCKTVKTHVSILNPNLSPNPTPHSNLMPWGRPRLADRELDVGTMSLKEVIRWQGARERAKLAEERRLRVGASLRTLRSFVEFSPMLGGSPVLLICTRQPAMPLPHQPVRVILPIFMEGCARAVRASVSTDRQLSAGGSGVAAGGPRRGGPPPGAAGPAIRHLPRPTGKTNPNYVSETTFLTMMRCEILLLIHPQSRYRPRVGNRDYHSPHIRRKTLITAAASSHTWVSWQHGFPGFHTV